MSKGRISQNEPENSPWIGTKPAPLATTAPSALSTFGKDIPEIGLADAPVPDSDGAATIFGVTIDALGIPPPAKIVIGDKR